MIDANVSVGITSTINEYYDELNYLSDLFTIENDTSMFYIAKEANYTDLSDVSIIIGERFKVDTRGRLPVLKYFNKI